MLIVTKPPTQYLEAQSLGSEMSLHTRSKSGKSWRTKKSPECPDNPIRVRNTWLLGRIKKNLTNKGRCQNFRNFLTGGRVSNNKESGITKSKRYPDILECQERPLILTIMSWQFQRLMINLDCRGLLDISTCQQIYKWNTQPQGPFFNKSFCTKSIN
jgi:hypothetical protein